MNLVMISYHLAMDADMLETHVWESIWLDGLNWSLKIKKLKIKAQLNISSLMQKAGGIGAVRDDVT